VYAFLIFVMYATCLINRIIDLGGSYTEETSYIKSVACNTIHVSMCQYPATI
jgi:hypothetical protein